jgi:hypothetical protein
VLHALHELRSVIDDRLRGDLGSRYDRHSARSAGTDKLTITFTFGAATHADAIRTAGPAAGTLAELLQLAGQLRADGLDAPRAVREKPRSRWRLGRRTRS